MCFLVFVVSALSQTVRAIFAFRIDFPCVANVFFRADDTSSRLQKYNNIAKPQIDILRTIIPILLFYKPAPAFPTRPTPPAFPVSLTTKKAHVLTDMRPTNV